MCPSRSVYPTDLTDPQWKRIASFMPKHDKSRGGRPRSVPYREIVNAVLYVVRGGCAWRLLPHDFPTWKTVYTYFRNWRKEGLEVLPHRWIVERTLAWLGRHRRMSKDYEALPETSETMVRIVMINLMLHRLHPERKVGRTGF
jgi:putative transposase